jgi:phage terminase Nu1 subunit (DNA packaging protein)
MAPQEGSDIGTQPYEVSRARREAALADLAEIELAQKRGQLVDNKEKDAEFIAHIALAKTRLLRVPSRLAQEMPDLADRVVPLAESLIREALEELSIDGSGQ